MSDKGGRLWHETSNDIYIVDPQGKIKHDELKAKLSKVDAAEVLKENVEKNSISEAKIHERPCKDDGTTVLNLL